MKKIIFLTLILFLLSSVVSAQDASGGLTDSGIAETPKTVTFIHNGLPYEVLESDIIKVGTFAADQNTGLATINTNFEISEDPVVVGGSATYQYTVFFFDGVNYVYAAEGSDTLSDESIMFSPIVNRIAMSISENGGSAQGLIALTGEGLPSITVISFTETWSPAVAPTLVSTGSEGGAKAPAPIILTPEEDVVGSLKLSISETIGNLDLTRISNNILDEPVSVLYEGIARREIVNHELISFVGDTISGGAGGDLLIPEAPPKPWGISQASWDDFWNNFFEEYKKDPNYTPKRPWYIPEGIWDKMVDKARTEAKKVGPKDCFCSCHLKLEGECEPTENFEADFWKNKQPGGKMSSWMGEWRYSANYFAYSFDHTGSYGMSEPNSVTQTHTGGSESGRPLWMPLWKRTNSWIDDEFTCEIEFSGKIGECPPPEYSAKQCKRECKNYCIGKLTECVNKKQESDKCDDDDPDEADADDVEGVNDQGEETDANDAITGECKDKP